MHDLHQQTKLRTNGRSLAEDTPILRAKSEKTRQVWLPVFVELSKMYPLGIFLLCDDRPTVVRGKTGIEGRAQIIEQQKTNSQVTDTTPFEKIIAFGQVSSRAC